MQCNYEKFVHRCIPEYFMYDNTVNICYVVINGCSENINIELSIHCLFTIIALHKYDEKYENDCS